MQAIDPATFNVISADPGNLAAVAKAASEVAKAQRITSAEAVNQLVAMRQVPKSDWDLLSRYGPALANCPSREP
jgi:hypothetical protein